MVFGPKTRPIGHSLPQEVLHVEVQWCDFSCQYWVRPWCSCLPYHFQVFVGQSCLPLDRIGGRGLPPRAPGAKFAAASPVLQKFANCVCLAAQVRGSCRCARVRSRRVGFGPTKRNSPQALFCPRLRFTGILCVSECVAPLERCSAWSVCRNLHSYAGVSR